jgi:glycosyltransferase involved in cell wall biosynthesis
MSEGLHVGFLLPAYGVEILGGAEYGARMIAEHLVDIGCRATVWTSTAMRAVDWAAYYEPGPSIINGVEVRRFPASPRAADFPARSDAILRSPATAPASLAEAWVDSQGPVFPAGLAAAVASDADVVVLYPYLYWPTVQGARTLGRRAVLQPAAHDEAPFHLPLFEDVFTRVGGLVFHSDAERRLVTKRFPLTAVTPQATLGLGVEAGPGDQDPARAALGVGERPYVLCLGRVDEHKGTSMLADWWIAYKARNPGPLALVFAGPVSTPPPSHPDIIVAGPVSDEVKWGALRGARVLISPSPYESFSLVLLEAWAVGTPAMVNGVCGPTVDHCRASGGGLPFSGYGTFEEGLRRLDADAELRHRLGAAGQGYVQARFGWDILARRYRHFLGSIARRHHPLADGAGTAIR